VFGFALFCLPGRPARAENAGRSLRRVDGVLDLLLGGLLLVGRNFRPTLIIESLLLVTGAVISAVGNAFLHANLRTIIDRSGECRLHSGESAKAREAEGCNENIAHVQFPYFDLKLLFTRYRFETSIRERSFSRSSSLRTSHSRIDRRERDGVTWLHRRELPTRRFRAPVRCDQLFGFRASAAAAAPGAAAGRAPGSCPRATTAVNNPVADTFFVNAFVNLAAVGTINYP
jgi:hypothetical protein